MPTTLIIPRKLNAGDRERLTAELCALERRVRELKREKREAAARYAANIWSIDAQILPIVEQLESGRVREAVEVEERPTSGGVMEVVRTDTGKSIATRKMTADEQQTKVPGADAPESDPDAEETPAEDATTGQRDLRFDNFKKERLTKRLAIAREKLAITKQADGTVLASLDVEGFSSREVGEDEEAVKKRLLDAFKLAISPPPPPLPKLPTEAQAEAVAEA